MISASKSAAVELIGEPTGPHMLQGIDQSPIGSCVALVLLRALSVLSASPPACSCCLWVIVNLESNSLMAIYVCMIAIAASWTCALAAVEILFPYSFLVPAAMFAGD